MSTTLAIANSQKLKINCHDPRCHQAFLQLSNDMHCWKLHINDNNWWQEREKQCCGLFQEYGYDLQSGVWYCLIACKRNSWEGVASSSQMLAESFTRQVKQCWPPMAAQDLRRQILSWYCIHILPLIYALPVTFVTCPALKQLLCAVELLQRVASTLQSPKRLALQQLSTWLESNIRVVELRISMTDTTSAQSNALYLSSINNKWWSKSIRGAFGVIVTLVCLIVYFYLKDPVFFRYSNYTWPENVFFLHWGKKSNENNRVLPIYTSYTQLNLQMDSLEERLIDAEKKRKPYLTISELKTLIYQMQQKIQLQEMTFEYELNKLEVLKNENKKISQNDLSSLSLKLDALNNRFLLLVDGNTP